MGYPTFHGQAVDLSEMLAGAKDLDVVIKAVAREQVIRSAMAETGESRQIVTETLDASISMEQEAVMDLTDGEPTTLAAGLQRYVDSLEQAAQEDESLRASDVVADLTAILNYPWPGEKG